MIRPVARLLLAGGLVTLLALPALAQPELRSIGFLPDGFVSQVFGLSADGRTVVGYCTTATGDRAIRWTADGGMEDLGTPNGQDAAYAQAASADGSFVVGSTTPTGNGFLWTGAGGFLDFGVLGGGGFSAANGVNANGSVVVGSSGSPIGERAVRWTSVVGLTSLGTLPGGSSSIGYATSADGSVVVGVSGSSSGERAFRWTEAGMVSLGTLPGGNGSRAFNVSADGTAVVGFSRTPGRERAFRWTEKLGMEDLGALGGDMPPSLSIAYAVSADGSRVGGRATFGLESHAFLWTAELGLVDLNLYLAKIGVDTGGWQLQDVFGISADGMTMAGNGINNGSFEGWILNLGSACAADFNEDDAVNSQDFFDFLTAFFAGDPHADFNDDSLVNSQDFFDFLTAFFAGCA